MRPLHPQIRELLLTEPDGLTASEIAKRLGKDVDSVRVSLRSMVDCYIDRWEGPYRGQYFAIHCVVEVPDDCPHPEH